MRALLRSPARQLTVRPQVAQGRRRLAQPLRQGRGVEVGIGVVRADLQGILVGAQRLGDPSEVLERHAEVEGGRPEEACCLGNVSKAVRLIESEIRGTGGAGKTRTRRLPR